MEFFLSHLKKGCANKFITAIHTALPQAPATVKQILENYSVKHDMPDEEAFSAILDYVNDISFFAPVISFAQGWPGSAYVYYFNEGNPWDGPYKGRASHILDIAYLFQNFREFMTPAQQSVATAFAADVFKFCHGIPPWPVAADIGPRFTARTYGPSSQKLTVGEVKQPNGRGSKRRCILPDYVEDQVSMDDLVKILKTFKSI